MERMENLTLKKKIVELKELLNKRLEENKIIHTKIHASNQEKKKMFELKKKINQFLKSNNNDKKKVNNEMEVFFLKKEILSLNKQLYEKVGKIQKLKNES